MKVKQVVHIKDADIRFFRDGAWIMFNSKSKQRINKHIDFKHYKMWIESIEILKELGYKPFIDKEFKKQFKTLLPTHAWGNKNGLKFEARIYPAGFSIEFYQDINFENKFGGKHDFNKYNKMPPRLKLSFNYTAEYLLKKLVGKYNLKLYDQSEIRFPKLTAEEQIIKRFREVSFDRNNITSLDQIESYMSDYDFKHNSNSGVSDILKCGQTRRFFGWDKKMHKGVIYHNINNMWWIITSKYKYTNVACFEIFEEVKGE